MTQSLRLFAKYTTATNEKLGALLAAMDPAEYVKDRTAYYKSIQGLHLHLLTTTKFLQTLIRTNSDNKYLVSPLTEEAFELKAGTAAEACRLQGEYDRNFLAFTSVLDEKDVTHPKTRRTMRSGRTFLLSLSDLLTQYMIHTTHHRGQLSQLLDELGLDHDFGSVWLFAEEVAPEERHT
jgi:uncharacterized damage-inducible protein DinB